MRAAFYKATRPGLQGVYSRAVRFIERGPYSHCELIFSDGMSASASWVDGGVRFKRIDYDPTHWDFVDLPAELEPYARDWFERNDGAPYDLPGNVRFVLPFLPDSESGWFCSEAIAAALRLQEPWRYGPNGLAALMLSIYTQGGTMHHTLEVPMGIFGPLGSTQTAVSFLQRTKRTGMPAPWLPDHLQKPLSAGDVVELSVPIPPGVSVVGWNAQFESRSCFFSSGNGPWESWEPPLFPLAYNPNIHPKPTQANRTFHFVSARMMLNRVEELLEFSITYTISDRALYEAWRTNGAPPVPAPVPAPQTPALDPALAYRTLTYAKRGGLVDALRSLSGAIDDDDLQAWALRQPGLWPAICRTVEIAEGGVHA